MSGFDELKAFKNKLADYSSKSDRLLSQSGDNVLDGKYAERLKSVASQLYGQVLQAYSQGEHVDVQDASVYTGNAGVALLHLKMGELEKAETAINSSLSRLRGSYKDCTFLCGDCGPLAIAAVIYNLKGTQFHSLRNSCVQKILDMERGVCESRSLPNELLYGRAGYLFTLLYLQRNLGDDVISKQSIINVAMSMIASGQQLSQQVHHPCPLMYSWYNELYTGAAHGHAGIIYLLIKVTRSILQSGESSDAHGCPLTFHWHNKHYLGGAHGYAGILYILIKVADKYPELNIDSVLRLTVDFLLNLKFPSGNFPSSFESGESDRLVHWCHGAPGFIYMFVAAYQRYGSESYKKAVLDCAQCIWKRGLLRKGYGICHGVAGNGYAFLSAYKMTGDLKHLHRAYQFALWCCDYGQHECRIPDRPYSLFEGMAGTAYFLLDMLSPQQARFPAFEL